MSSKILILQDAGLSLDEDFDIWSLRSASLRKRLPLLLYLQAALQQMTKEAEDRRKRVEKKLQEQQQEAEEKGGHVRNPVGFMPCVAWSDCF